MSNLYVCIYIYIYIRERSQRNKLRTLKHCSHSHRRTLTVTASCHAPSLCPRLLHNKQIGTFDVAGGNVFLVPN
jgi:hypothetical protein